MKHGHGDRAARRSLLDRPDIDLPCHPFMILFDWWDGPRFPAAFPQGKKCRKLDQIWVTKQ